jgi:exonuclease SbcD
MKLRVLHTADVHLGRRFAYLGDRAAAHGARVAGTFRRACQLAREGKCHLMLIAGDLFDSPRVERRWVSLCLELFSGLNIPVAVLPGNHDPAAGHPLSQQTLPPNVHLLTGDVPLSLPALQTLVYSCPPETQSRWQTMLQRDPNGATFQIGLLHGSMPVPGKTGDLDNEMIAQSELDYIALGDWHSPRNFSSGRTVAWYSGSPEMIMPDQDLPGKVLIIDLSEEAMPVVETVAIGEAIPLGDKAIYELDLSPYEHWNEIVEALQVRLTPATVAQIKLTGHWQGTEPPDTLQLAEFLRHHCLYAKLESAFAMRPPEPETPFEKAFAALVHQHMESDPTRLEIYDEAYSLGMHLLRGGRL